jgi:TetR/AcrR family transcriptional repressor of nem operon
MPHGTMPVRINRKLRAKRHGDTRVLLIRLGTELCTERGFQVTGIDEVLKRAGVPKGSFYHFFASLAAVPQTVAAHPVPMIIA